MRGASTAIVMRGYGSSKRGLRWCWCWTRTRRVMVPSRRRSYTRIVPPCHRIASGRPSIGASSCARHVLRKNGGYYSQNSKQGTGTKVSFLSGRCFKKRAVVERSTLVGGGEEIAAAIHDDI